MAYEAAVERAMNHVALRNAIILFGCVRGSHIYGVATPESDVDMMLVVLPRWEIVFGFESFGHDGSLELLDPDVSIYTLPKFVRLALKGNPNILEPLFADRTHHIAVHDAFRPMLEGLHRYLGTSIVMPYLGYARSQLGRNKRANRKVADDAPYDGKNIMHMMRLAWTIEDYLKTGVLWVKRPPEEIAKLQRIRRCEIPIEELVAEFDTIDARARAHSYPNLAAVPDRESIVGSAMDVIRNLMP